MSKCEWFKRAAYAASFLTHNLLYRSERKEGEAPALYVADAVASRSKVDLWAKLVEKSKILKRIIKAAPKMMNQTAPRENRPERPPTPDEVKDFVDALKSGSPEERRLLKDR